MLQGADPGWTHGRQRGQFGSQTLHSAFFAHQHHHARNRFSDARRNHLGQIRQCRVVVRLGLVPIRFQPVSARRARVLARVFQGRLQAPSQQKGARGGSAGHDSPRRFHSTHQVDLVLSNRASISGQSSRTVPGGVAKAMHRNVHLHRRCGSRSVQRFRHDVRSGKDARAAIPRR